MAEVKPSTSPGEDAAEVVGETSCSGAEGSTSLKSVPSAIAAKFASFFTGIWISILTACSGLWGARKVSRIASGAQQPQEDSESEVSSQIAASKKTWSEVPARDIHPSVPDPRSNQPSVWEELKESAPHFFRDDLWAKGLVLGRQIAQGGQAQIFEAKYIWDDSEQYDYVLKVFKLEAKFSLTDLKRHWPRSTKKRNELPRLAPFFSGLRTMENGGEDSSESRSMQETSSRFVFDDFKSTLEGQRCFIRGATLLNDGRFAFVMQRYWGDLRTLIDLKVKDNIPPFSFQESIRIMLQIARGMQGLHAEGVLHRDLKAANVLINILEDNGVFCNVADYECAMFVEGTRFWRAPEVLEELLKKEKVRNKDIWTEKVDVYSFGMTCYEILTGQIPFEDYTKKNWGKVIKGDRPSLPDYIFPELRKLVEACWHSEPLKRPSFEVIIINLYFFRSSHTTWI